MAEQLERASEPRCRRGQLEHVTSPERREVTDAVSAMLSGRSGGD